MGDNSFDQIWYIISWHLVPCPQIKTWKEILNLKMTTSKLTLKTEGSSIKKPLLQILKYY